MLFTYATARSLITAKKVTKGIKAKIPLIVYNGAFVMDNFKFHRMMKMALQSGLRRDIKCNAFEISNTVTFKKRDGGRIKFHVIN